ncbi:MAG: group 1 glycosyl transferase [Rhodobiaceae bacterium]|nr:MAG: group 1 glycosyl transferase [Rhodobiaceae bacterium]
MAGYNVVVIAPALKTSMYNDIRLEAFPRISSRLRRVVVGLYRMTQMAIREKADIYQFHDPELIGVAILLRFLGKRVVYDVHEDLPQDVYNKDFLPRRLLPFIAFIVACVEAVSSRLFSGIVTATPTIAARFPEHKTVCVKNYPVWESYGSATMAVPDAPASAVYVGGLSEVRGIEIMLEAARGISEKRPYTLLLAGKFRPQSLEVAATEHDFVEYLGQVSPDNIPEILAKAQIGIVVLSPLQSYIDALPLKLFEYMAAGLPIIASNFGVMKKIVSESKCGLLVQPGSVKELAEAQEYLFDHPEEATLMGKRGRAAIQQKYNWEKEAAVLVDFYDQL